MTYNPEKSEERSALPEDVVFEGVITHIEDGSVKDFVQNLEKWKDPDSLAINVDMEISHEDKTYKFSELFTYRTEGETTVYGSKSKLGKFKKKYLSIPKVGLKIKALTNNEGFLRLKIE